jgi:hypothetical protein
VTVEANTSGHPRVPACWVNRQACAGWPAGESHKKVPVNRGLIGSTRRSATGSIEAEGDGRRAPSGRRNELSVAQRPARRRAAAYGAAKDQAQTGETSFARGALSAKSTRTFRAMPMRSARRTLMPEVSPRSPRDRWDVVIQLARATTAVAIMVTTIIHLV